MPEIIGALIPLKITAEDIDIVENAGLSIAGVLQEGVMAGKKDCRQRTNCGMLTGRVLSESDTFEIACLTEDCPATTLYGYSPLAICARSVLQQIENARQTQATPEE